jgi:hypothetical protein
MFDGGRSRATQTANGRIGSVLEGKKRKGGRQAAFCFILPDYSE